MPQIIQHVLDLLVRRLSTTCIYQCHVLHTYRTGGTSRLYAHAHVLSFHRTRPRACPRRFTPPTYRDVLSPATLHAVNVLLRNVARHPAANARACARVGFAHSVATDPFQLIVSFFSPSRLFSNRRTTTFPFAE